VHERCEINYQNARRAERWPRIMQFNRESLLFHGSSSLSVLRIPGQIGTDRYIARHIQLCTVVLKSHYSEKINI